MVRTLLVFCLLAGCAVGVGVDQTPDENGCVEGGRAVVMIPGVGARDVGRDCPAVE